MPNSKEIKNRIKSVRSTKKITKAMELVAASKMKRAVSSALSSRLYAEYSWEVLTSIANGKNGSEEGVHPLFIDREMKNGKGGNILLILITSNRGLCGAYNAQVIKKAISFLKEAGNFGNGDSSKIDIISIGKKGDLAMRRLGKKILASFFDFPSNISISDIIPVSEMAMNEYNLMHYDKVLVAYTDFVSALSQKPNIKELLPISKTSLKELIDNLEGGFKNKEQEKTKEKSIKNTEYLFEGNKEELMKSLAEKITRMQIYQMFLESNASEQSSRMVAMKNASEAAGEMIEDLTLMFNKARQSGITREISEISAGMASVN